MLRRVYQGLTDSDMLNDFVTLLLHHCGRYSEPKYVLVMDNAYLQYSDRFQQMCQDAGVVLVFLSPYSPDINPNEEYFEEYFGVLRKSLKKKWHVNGDFITGEFIMFLEWCVDVVGDDVHIAENHFRHEWVPIT
jgi:hypothetical protein